MHGTIIKAEPQERQTLDRQALRLHRAWMVFIRYMRGEALEQLAPLFERRDVGKLIHAIDQGIFTALSTTWDKAANDVAADTTRRINAKIGKAVTVSSSFKPGDPDAADLMRRQKLTFISGLTLDQRNITRRALEDGIRRGLGTEALARTFRDTIGLTPAQQKELNRREATWQRSAPNTLDREAGATDADFMTPEQIARNVERSRASMVQARAETIARTEALAVTGTAQDLALRESLRDTGIETSKVFKTWNCTRDGRERPEHAARDGVTIPLNDSFASGIYKPGDGGPREAINCRCVLTYSFED